MYKIIVADSELAVTQFLSCVVKKNFDCLSFCGIALSGKAAIELCSQTRPDIVVVDINLNGINGFETAKQIKKIIPDASIILMSQYDCENHTQAALSVGALGYLLKPVSEPDFVETIKAVITQISYRIEKNKEELALREKYNISVPIIEAGFINCLCVFDRNEYDYENYYNYFSFADMFGYIIVIEFADRPDAKNKQNDGVSCHRKQIIYKDLIKSMFPCIIGSPLQNRLIVYVFCESKSDTPEQKQKAESLAKKLYAKFKHIHMDVHIGIGGFCYEFLQAKDSYFQALKALRSIKCKYNGGALPVLHSNDIDGITEKPQTDSYEQLEKKAVQFVSELNVNTSLTLFDDIFSQICYECMPNFEMVKNKCIMLITDFIKTWSSMISNYWDFFDEILASKDTVELGRACRWFIGQSIRHIANSKQKKISAVIEKANTYMEENYCTDIPLEIIAKEVNLSPYYFSHFYKQETGMKFIDKLTAIRIEKAKHYIETTQFTIKEISNKVGYTDSSYFSRLFKRFTGLTATDYKKKQL